MTPPDGAPPGRTSGHRVCSTRSGAWTILLAALLSVTLQAATTDLDNQHLRACFDERGLTEIQDHRFGRAFRGQG